MENEPAPVGRRNQESYGRGGRAGDWARWTVADNSYQRSESKRTYTCCNHQTFDWTRRGFTLRVLPWPKRDPRFADIPQPKLWVIAETATQ
jgi:hypothetical protein